MIMDITKKQQQQQQQQQQQHYHHAYTTKPPQPLAEVRTEKGIATTMVTYCHFPCFFDV
jgi:hypothetical protein